MKPGDRVRTPQGEGVSTRQGSGGWFVRSEDVEHFIRGNRAVPIEQAVNEQMPPVEVDPVSPRRRKSK